MKSHNFDEGRAGYRFLTTEDKWITVKEIANRGHEIQDLSEPFLDTVQIISHKGKYYMVESWHAETLVQKSVIPHPFNIEVEPDWTIKRAYEHYQLHWLLLNDNFAFA